MTRLDDLLRLLPPGGERGGSYDWAETAARLGVRDLPSDFKALIAAYGDVMFCAGIRPFHPSEFDYVDLAGLTLEVRETLLMDDFGEVPETVDAKTTIAWGTTLGGDHFLWDASDDDPEKWTVMTADIDQLNWGFYPGSTTDFIYDWITEALPAEPPMFNPGYDFIGGVAFCELYDPADPTTTVVDHVETVQF